jgi:hypothetical protein
MKTYTLHVAPAAAPGDPRALDRAILVKDGFSWGAFFFSFLWFFAHRLWIAGLMVLVAAAALGALLQGLRVGPAGTFLAAFLLALLIGLEANSLRRWTLARGRRPAIDAVGARDLEEAETKSFARWLGERPGAGPSGLGAQRPQALPATSLQGRGEAVIGLFPEAERTR